MKSANATREDLREYIATLPVIDCHDHAGEIGSITDILAHMAETYFGADLMSASRPKDIEKVRDTKMPLEERWPIFERAYRATRFTGYAENVRMAVEKVFGEKEITLESVRRMQAGLPDLSDPKVYYRFYDDARIVARIAHTQCVIDGFLQASERLLRGQRLAVALPYFHQITTRAEIEKVEEFSGREVTSLEEYVEACRAIFARQRELGAVCFKDNSAYNRSLVYRSPVRARAEEAFNRIVADPRYRAEFDPDDNPLSDFLMHSFMRMARDFDMPVQLHTGHMAGIRNDVAKANAAGLRGLLETHRETRFDLFHGNWPYAGDLLFLVKNYPNVAMDLCWVHIIDPVYSRDLLKSAVSSVPHSKIHGFGSDVGGGEPDFAWAHAEMAKDNIAFSLAELVDEGVIGADDAREIAADVLFRNPNEFFRLGLSFEDHVGK